jgi:hypothetical protein
MGTVAVSTVKGNIYANIQTPAIQLILEAKNLKPEFQYLNIRLQLERQRLWNWSEVSGLLDYLGGKEDALDTSRTGLNRHVILEVVCHIQTLVTEFVKVKGRYQHLAPDPSIQREALPRVPANSLTKVAISSSEDLAIDRDSEFINLFPGSRVMMEKFMRSLEVTQQLPKRLRWAAWDQDKFKGLVDRLKELNDCLLDLVDNSVKMEIFLKTKETNISFLELHNKMDDLRQIFLALSHHSPSSAPHIPLGLRINQGLSSVQQEEENKELLDLTRFKALNQSIEHGTLDVHVATELQLQQPGEQMRDSKLDRADIKLEEAELDDSQSYEGLRCEAFYRSQPVWIEWKEYQPIDFASPKPAPNILARVQKLAALLRKDENPIAFRVPHCLGYFDDAQRGSHFGPQHLGDDVKDTENSLEPKFRFGFVFSKPLDVNPSTVPVSLLELVKKSPKPSLTERVALAKIIANCIRYLHSVNWLHKGLRSQNIIFFPRSQTNKVDYTKPYLSGFDYARPEWREEMTEAPPANPEYDIYKHPRIHHAADREGYRKSFDIYSLGIILMEIAEWKTIDVIVGIANPKTVKVSEVWTIRERLLSEEIFMQDIATSMGLLFKSSVWYCLKGDTTLGMTWGLDEIGTSAGIKFSNEFYKEVVRRLEEIIC